MEHLQCYSNNPVSNKQNDPDKDNVTALKLPTAFYFLAPCLSRGLGCLGPMQAVLEAILPK